MERQSMRASRFPCMPSVGGYWSLAYSDLGSGSITDMSSHFQAVHLLGWTFFAW